MEEYAAAKTDQIPETEENKPENGAKSLTRQNHNYQSTLAYLASDEMNISELSISELPPEQIQEIAQAIRNSNMADLMLRRPRIEASAFDETHLRGGQELPSHAITTAPPLLGDPAGLRYMGIGSRPFHAGGIRAAISVEASRER